MLSPVPGAAGWDDAVRCAVEGKAPPNRLTCWPIVAPAVPASVPLPPLALVTPASRAACLLSLFCVACSLPSCILTIHPGPLRMASGLSYFPRSLMSCSFSEALLYLWSTPYCATQPRIGPTCRSFIVAFFGSGRDCVFRLF